MSLLALHGIRIPESFIFREESYAKNKTYLEEHFTFPLVFKTDGSRGRNVYRVETRDALHAHIQNKQPQVLAL